MQISSTTVSDSEGHSSSMSSGCSSLSVTSGISPPAVFTLLSNHQQVQNQVNVIVGSDSLASAAVAGTSNINFNTALCDSSSISSISDNNSHAPSASPSSSSFSVQINNSSEFNASSQKSESICGKKRKELVRDDAYWERRRKNNDAAKRSRDSRRRKVIKLFVFINIKFFFKY